MSFILDLIKVFKSNKKVEKKLDNLKQEKDVKDNKNQTSNDLVLLNYDAILIEARAKAKEIILDAKDQALKQREQLLNEVRASKEKSIEIEKDFAVRKAKIETLEKEIESKAKTLKLAKESIEKKQKEIDLIFDEQKNKLESIALLSKDDAKKILLEGIEKELVNEKGKKIRQIEDDLKKDASKLAKQILIDAMEFSATDIVVERSTSKVKLPDEDIRGRIIGKEGRNIKSFEELTGVELDLDSSPNEIVVSSFDSVKREIAKISLEKLILDGRIQPSRIEEIVEKTSKEIDSIIFKAGDDLCHKLGVYTLPKEIIQLLGKFKYRFSYGQNMIEHTLETARIGIFIATKLDVNVEIVKMGCILHDIGKVITDTEGSHVDIGVDLLKKFNIDEKVIACVNEHHGDTYSSNESAIVALADHISGSRPGSRSEDYESYVKRLKDLEQTALSFDGVEKVYALSAGREIRVFVSPDKVDDDSVAYLAREIAKKIELEQTYPGIVKIVVIRETRVTETAK